MSDLKDVTERYDAKIRLEKAKFYENRRKKQEGELIEKDLVIHGLEKYKDYLCKNCIEVHEKFIENMKEYKPD